MSDNKVSLLINRQVPEFVREEYPVFISFLEAYYEFLENKQGTNKNDLISKSKDIRYISDVDDSIDYLIDALTDVRRKKLINETLGDSLDILEKEKDHEEALLRLQR